MSINSNPILLGVSEYLCLSVIICGLEAEQKKYLVTFLYIWNPKTLNINKILNQAILQILIGQLMSDGNHTA